MKDTYNFRIVQYYYDENWNETERVVRTGDIERQMTILYNALKLRYTIRTIRFTLEDKDGNIVLEHLP